MKPMRIAYVINSVEGGGAALPVPAVTGVLRGCGAQVKVFALTPRDRRALPFIEAADLTPSVREGGDGDHLAALIWLRRELRQWGATHIWTSLSRATLLGLLIGPNMGLPVICWQHAAYLKPWNQRLLHWLQSRATLWIGDSQSVTRLTAERLGVTPDRLVTWPIFSADPSMPQARVWQPGEPVRLGSLGRLHPVKGYDVLIDALALLRTSGFTPPTSFTIDIAGDGTEKEALTSRVADAGVNNINLIGYVNEPRQFLQGLHLYLQPSRSEGFCIAAHEAMTAGLPVIGSAVGEMPYSIQNNVSGLTVPPHNPHALAKALRDLLTAPERLEAMGQNAREFMLENYSRAHFTEIGRAIFNRIAPASA